VLRGRKALVVDDDARNIFALTTLLESQDMDVISATNGRQAVELVQSTDDLSIILMDIMMPEMDGYETMRAIREEPQFRSLPIIALTAKAMKGDRAKCIEAGATDYITKPVDLEQLFSVLRVSVSRGYELTQVAVPTV
jgi:CheY-like chemotaxis protein